MPQSSDPNQLSEHLPLREPTFYILLSLSASDKHGYAILKDVGDLSQAKVQLSTGTLYEALARLLDQDLIAPVEPHDLENQLSHPGRPRKAYRLTSKGHWVLRAETSRLQGLLAAAQRHLGEEMSS